MVHQYCKSKLSQMVLLWHISCSEFILNIKFPIGTFAVFLELFVLSSIIQAHKFDSKPCILPMISLNTSWLNHAIFCLIEVRKLHSCAFVDHDLPIWFSHIWPILQFLALQSQCPRRFDLHPCQQACALTL
jgi:hypothetical protein